MSVHISRRLEGERMASWEVTDISLNDKMRTYAIGFGDDIYFLSFSKITPATHTMPAGPRRRPTDEEMAELVGRMYVRVCANGKGVAP